jgi:hypothetical protein
MFTFILNDEEREMFIQLIDTFMPMKDDPNYEKMKAAGLTTLTRQNFSDILMVFMREPEQHMEKSIFLTLLDNTMIENGKLVNIREYVRNKYKDRYSSLLGEYMMSREQQTFNDITIKTLTYNDTKYFALIINKWRGRYRYPSIREDWQTYLYTIAYLMEEIEYKKLVNYNEPKFKYVIEYDQEFETYDETKFLDLIQTKITTKKSNYGGNEYDWILPIKKINDKVRFLSPTLVGLIRSKHWAPHYNMEKEYFETNVNNFNKLLTIK